MSGDAGHLFHVADREEWAAAEAAGRYERSTRGRSLAQEGFVHLSTPDQWRGVLTRFYADVDRADLVLLEVDPARLDAPLRWEVGDPATGEEFPHLYGPLPVAAVVAVLAVTDLPPVSG